jgi:hypothetical protein
MGARFPQIARDERGQDDRNRFDTFIKIIILSLHSPLDLDQSDIVALQLPSW